MYQRRTVAFLNTKLYNYDEHEESSCHAVLPRSIIYGGGRGGAWLDNDL